jgi:hypothetical protein
MHAMHTCLYHAVLSAAPQARGVAVRGNNNRNRNNANHRRACA